MREACEKCGLYLNCQSPHMAVNPVVEGAIVNNPILLVGEAPGPNEDRVGDQFVGRSGKLLVKGLQRAKVPLQQCVKQNAVRCYPGVQKMCARFVNACRDLLVEDIERLRPRAILLLGAPALQSVVRKAGITKHRRTRLEYTLKDGVTIPVVAAFHPAYILRNLDLEDRFMEDLQYFADILTGTVEDVVRKVLPNLYPSVEDIRAFHVAHRNKWIAVDVETTSLLLYTDNDWRLLSCAVSDGKETLVLGLDPRGDADAQRDRMVELMPTSKALFALLEDPMVGKIGHNIKYDIKAIHQRFGVRVGGALEDTMLLHSLRYPIVGGHGLKDVASELLGVHDYARSLRSYIGDGNDAAKYGTVPYSRLGEYNGVDAYVTYLLRDKLHAELAKMLTKFPLPGDGQGQPVVEGMSPDAVYEKIALPTLDVLCKMEQRGFYVDEPTRAKLEQTLDERLRGLYVAICTMPGVVRFVRDRRSVVLEDVKRRIATGKRKPKAGALHKKLEALAFLPSSDKQVRDVLFTHDNEKYPGKNYYAELPVEFTDGGVPSTKAEVLKQLAVGSHNQEVSKLCRLLLEYSSESTLQSTFVRGLKKYIGEDGRIHSSFNQAVARTGRLSSSKPNLQNVPVVSKVRDIYWASDGCKLIIADYSQVELRVLAALSHDAVMRDAFIQGKDIHVETAMAILEIDDPAQVPAEMRRAAKGVNFGIAYGLTAQGLAVSLAEAFDRPVSIEDAQQFINGFFRKYPGVARWQETVMAFAERNGYVYTLFGRCRLLKNATIKVRHGEGGERHLKQEALRQAMNTPVQGSASDINLLAMNALDAVLGRLPISCALVSNVHDSLIVEVQAAYAGGVARMVKRVMEDVPSRFLKDVLDGIPLTVDLKIGQSWGSAVDFEVK